MIRLPPRSSLSATLFPSRPPFRSSQQALASFGAGKGSRVGMRSANRPEVLHTVNALQLLATMSAPMHPLGGLDEHLHVVTDADVQFLVFDARYAERALQLAQRAPNLRLLSFGPQPGDRKSTRLNSSH